MKFFFTIFFSVLFFLNCEKSNSQEQDPIDTALSECMNEDYSTQGMLRCINTAIESYDLEMNKVYNSLMEKLSFDDRELLRESQRTWINFRDKDIKSIEAIYANFDGTMYLPMQAIDRMNLTKHRVQELKSYHWLFEME